MCKLHGKNEQTNKHLQKQTKIIITCQTNKTQTNEEYINESESFIFHFVQVLEALADPYTDQDTETVIPLE